MKIRRDAKGLYIRSRWHSTDPDSPAYRPGYFAGYSHAWNTTEADLKEGDNPKTSHVNGAPFIKITTSDGRTIYWGSYGRQEGDFSEEQTE